MHVEHINPEGGDGPENLALSCSNCNLSKATTTTALDPETNQVLPLFNPRTETWSSHFEWIEGSRLIRGITPIGRATVERLRMNRERIAIAREAWIRAGEHPPRP
jgi:hypothetical protein